MFPQNSHNEALTPNAMVSGVGLWEVIRVRWGHEDGAPIMGDQWPYTRRRDLTTLPPSFPSLPFSYSSKCTQRREHMST